MNDIDDEEIIMDLVNIKKKWSIFVVSIVFNDGDAERIILIGQHNEYC